MTQINLHAYRIEYAEEYAKFKNGEITLEQWHEYCSNCLSEILDQNIDVLVRMKDN